MVFLKRLAATILFLSVVLYAADKACRLGQSRLTKTVDRWYSVKKGNKYLYGPGMPPFRPLCNARSDDRARLKYIYFSSPWSRFSKKPNLPAGKTWSVPDVAQSPERAEETLFTIRMNSLGFRNPEFRARKLPGVYRIIALGGYVTFGQGVENEDAYPRQLEKALNRRDGRLRFEVWNGGMQAGRPIVALGRMRFELFNYRPDAFILNFPRGSFDFLSDAYSYPAPIRYKGPRLFSAVDELEQLIFRWTGRRSRILELLMGRLTDHYRPLYLSWWDEVLGGMIQLAQERRVPVILLSQGHVESYREFLAKHPAVHLVDVEDAFRKHPPTSQQTALFEVNSWLRDYPGEEAAIRKEMPFYAYYVDSSFPNAFGHTAIAKELASVVDRIVSIRKPAP